MGIIKLTECGAPLSRLQGGNWQESRRIPEVQNGDVQFEFSVSLFFLLAILILRAAAVLDANEYVVVASAGCDEISHDKLGVCFCTHAQVFEVSEVKFLGGRLSVA